MTWKRTQKGVWTRGTQRIEYNALILTYDLFDGSVLVGRYQTFAIAKANAPKVPR